jgi:hypothetical protein
MKRKQKLFQGIAVMFIAVIITIVGCEKGATFPLGFRGTWEREGQYTNTLTFTSNMLKASNQKVAWNLQLVLDDMYTIIYPGSSHGATITIKRKNGNLEISGDGGSGEDNWNGTWKKQ